jgi:hypothetical protein
MLNIPLLFRRLTGKRTITILRLSGEKPWLGYTIMTHREVVEIIQVCYEPHILKKIGPM